MDSRAGHVDIEGCVNLRDAGGWPLAGGGRMRTGLLYRGDDPLRLTPAGRAAVDHLGLRAAIDLRQQAQFARGPGFLDPGRTHHRPLVDRVVDLDDPPPLREPSHLTDMYTAMIAASRPQIAGVLDLLAGELAHGPALVHCVLGKDRTGVIVALVHVALGVHPDHIADDYARSHDPGMRRYRWMLDDPLPDDPPVHKAPPYLFGAPRDAMVLLLERMVATHGTLDAWLASFPIAPGTVAGLRRALIEHT